MRVFPVFFVFVMETQPSQVICGQMSYFHITASWRCVADVFETCHVRARRTLMSMGQILQDALILLQ